MNVISLCLRIMIGSTSLFTHCRPFTSHSLRISAGTQHQPSHHPLALSRSFITDTRSGNSPPRQRHGNSIAQPNDPLRRHDAGSWRARELSRRTNQVLYMAIRYGG
ncbi:hypothetical protein B0T18DRAFT_185277 [Schizothecium vesticola]|uniref:Uncharacterized protein n=1 Tax=Schizothecium vesticola TaxID=314040 RepID=A0AA40K2D9_9PEZI|nr:hypothetical protein B0T18DRAFT_185277 [Schizothecium vesticola]